MKNNNKTPYELRFDIYVHATQNLTDRYFSEVEEYKIQLAEYTNALALSEKDGCSDCDREAPQRPVRPEYPTSDEIEKEARRIKSFVEDKN